MKIKEGKEVPTFKLQDQDENTISSEGLRGQKYVLFFYPKDDTPGCTSEACSLRDSYKEITDKGYKIIGVSPDKISKHRRFADKYGFQFPLLADPEKQMIRDFGLWGPKKFMGREYEGVHRSTILVDENGKVEHIITKVNTKGHSRQILNIIEEKELAISK